MEGRMLAPFVFLTHAFCRCYYQMAVQQVNARLNQPHLQAKFDSEVDHVEFYCG
jgi:hypothetical protein